MDRSGQESEPGETLVISRRFRGPPDSGNGGYVCGLLGGFVDAPAAAVRLRVPPPLETPLEVRCHPDGADMLCGDQLVAQALPTDLEVVPGEAPSYEEAETAAGSFRGFDEHWFPGCFVCGPEREPGDGLRIFAAPIAKGDLVACPWVPDASLAPDGDAVAPEFLWAALDCPGGFSFPSPADGHILLGELAVALAGAVRVGERCVLTAREISQEGRKHHTATALFGQDGSCRGVGLATWFEVV